MRGAAKNSHFQTRHYRSTWSASRNTTYMAGITRTVSKVDEARPNSSEIARPWKIGSSSIVAAPIMAASAVSRDRLEANRAGFQQHLAQGFSLPRAVADEIDQQDRVAHDNAGERDESDHRGGGKRRAEQPMPEHDADQSERDRREDHQRQLEAAELRDHQDIDADDRHA